MNWSGQISRINQTNRIFPGNKIALGIKLILPKTKNFYLKDIAPNFLVEKVQAVWGKPVKTNIVVELTKMKMVELLRTTVITRKEYNTLCKN